MTKRCFITGLVLLLSIIAEPLMADDSVKDSPWEKFSFNAGAFLSSSNTDLRFGSGAGISINVEEAFGMEAKNRVFRVDSFWRFTANRRHRIDFSWFSYNRTGSRTITEEITIEPPVGEDIIIFPGTKVESYMDLDIFQLDYSYSFIQDDRLDLAATLGLYVMPTGFGFSATGIVDDEGDQSFTAPLPTLGLKVDVLLAPKWYLRSGFQLFYLEYEEFTGSLINVRSAVEYNPWKHVGFGLGVDALRFGLKADGTEDYPGIDLRGDVKFGYTGLMLYGRVFF
ncbi:MAG: hypothetical protein JRE12_16470 [Deltaproteobacteria bacterium]|nr:hypothetical protein [Deltaproteobacteria bacterium]